MASKDKTDAASVSPQVDLDATSPAKRITRSHVSETTEEPKEKSSPASGSASLPVDHVTAGTTTKRITQSKESEAKEGPKEKSSPATEGASPPVDRAITSPQKSEVKDVPKEKLSPITEKAAPVVGGPTSGTATKRITRSNENEASKDPKEKLSPSTKGASPPVGGLTSGTATIHTTRSKVIEAREDPKVKLLTTKTASPQVSLATKSGSKDDPKKKSSPAKVMSSQQNLTESEQSKNKTIEIYKIARTPGKGPTGNPNKKTKQSYTIVNQKGKRANETVVIDFLAGGQGEKQTRISKEMLAKSNKSDKSDKVPPRKIKVKMDTKATEISGKSSEKEDDEQSQSTGEEQILQILAPEEQILECKFCSEFFILTSLKQHIEEKHTHVETEVCPTCGYCEVKGGPMKDHPSCFACWTCMIFFNTKWSLKEHMALHDIPDENEEWLVCDSCQAKFSTMKALLAHSKCHEVDVAIRKANTDWMKDPPIRANSNSEDESDDDQLPIEKCRGCKKFFKSSKSLRRHVRKIHTKVKTEICETCGFFEKGGGPVGEHLCATESDEEKSEERRIRAKRVPGERFACKLCPKTYAFHQGLRAHMNTHKPASEKPWRCEVCQKAFSKKILYQDHVRIHSGDKPFMCHLCAKMFRSGANLRQHYRRCKKKVHHDKETPTGGSALPIGGSAQGTFMFPEGEQVPVLMEEEPVIYEVQMEIMDGLGETVVIDLSEVEQSVARAHQKRLNLGVAHQKRMEVEGMQSSVVLNEATGVMMEPNEEDVETRESTKALSQYKDATGHEAKHPDDDSNVVLIADEDGNVVPVADDESNVIPVADADGNVIPVADEDGNVVPIAIHTIKYEQTEDEGKPDEEPPGGDNNDDGRQDQDMEGEDNTPEPMDDSDQSNPPPVEHGDHDYIKESQSVLEEQQLEKNIEPKLLEVYFMCPYCKGLLDSKLSTKRHIKSKHKKAKKFDGIVVLGQPEKDSKKDSKNKKGGEDTLPVAWAYQCSDCHLLFSEEEIDAHLESVKIKSGACKICFRIHKEGAKSKYQNCKLSRARKVFQCPYCKVKPCALCELRSHLVMKHGKNTYPCTLCDASFQKKRGLSCHLQKHRRENEPKTVRKKKEYTCEKCGKVLPDSQSYRVHVMHHDNPKPFACKLCPKTYTFPNGLRVHMRSHTKNFPFLCEYCSRTFKTKACLVCHIRCHTGDKPFDCARCGKAFRSKANLRQHLLRCNVPKVEHTIEHTSVESELEIATEIVTEQPETYLLLVQKGDQEYVKVV